MADENTIRVVITGVASDLRRALEDAKGDLGGLKAAIKDVPNKIKIDVQAETAAATIRLRELRDLAKDVPNRIEIKADADTGIASAKLRLLKAEARDAETAIARASLGSLLSGAASAGGGAGGPGGILSGIPGGGGGAGVGIAAAGAPAIAGVLGSATAVVGSAGAGLLGAGAIGTAALGAGGVGLGSMLAVLIPAKAGIEAVSKAMENLDKAQQTYGVHSKQAATAQKELNAAVKDAGPGASQIAKQLATLGDLWSTVSKPAQQALYQIIIPALKVVKDLMPTVAAIAKESFGAIGDALKPVFAGLSSQGFKNVLTALGDAFAQLASPVIAAGANLVRAFLNVAVAASPYLIEIAQAFERWTQSFANSLSPGLALNRLIGGLVGQLRSWWELAKSLGGLMITIFSAGAGSGQSLVNMLTSIVSKWNAWLNTKAGQDAMRTFFANSKDLVVKLFDALGPLIGALIKLSIDLMPTFTLVLKAVTPVLNLLAGGISLLAGALSSKLVQAVAVAAIVFLPGGPLILGLVALGDIISHLPQILQALKDAWRFVWDAMKVAFNASLSFILGGLSSLLGAIKSVVDSANIKIPGLGHLFGDLGTSTSKHLGDAQTAIDNYRQTLSTAADKASADMGQIGDSTEQMGHRVDAAVTKMTQSVQTGIVTTDSALGKEMAKLGVTVQQVLTGASSHPLQPKPAFGKAGGGLIQVGRAGDRGRDAIPLSVGGQDIVVGAGEQVAVFNAQQQAVMNARLGDMGGLPGMFARHNRPHYMASGGMVGNIGAMIAEANRVDAAHFPYAWGGGHGSFTGPFDCSGAVSDILHAGGVLNAPRVSGDFMSYGLPGPGAVTLYANPTHVYMSIDGRYFGTSGSNPGGGAGWFDGAPRPGFAVRHIGGSVDTIKTPPWTGPGGLLGTIGKKQVSLAGKAANQTLARAMSQSFAGSFGGGQHSENLANQAIGQRMMLAHGWGMDQWPFLQRLWTKESGWDATARNPQTGAAGIPQDISGNSHGGAAGQIAWGLDYIAGRYGSPQAAWAHEVADNWYARGGLVGAAGGFLSRVGRGHPKWFPYIQTPIKAPTHGPRPGLRADVLSPVNTLLQDITDAQRDYGAWSTYYAATDPGGLTPAEVSKLVGYDQRQLGDIWGLGQTIPILLAAGANDKTLAAKFDAASMRSTLAGLGDQSLGVQADIINLTRPGAAASVGPDLAALLALQTTLTGQALQNYATSQSQFGVLSGFAPLLAGRLVGSFQSGIGFVPRTGMALVHRGETIIPDPAGPAGNRAAATVHTAQGPVQITLTFQNNEQPLVKLVSAEMNKHALQIVSDHSGQRARLLAGVRRP